MKSVAVALLALAEIGSGQATGLRVTARQLVDAPKDYLGRTIVVPGLGCVDPMKGGFLCVAIVGGQALRIEGGALGPKTEIAIAERMTRDCRGTANLDRKACRVDVEIAPTSGVREMMDTANGSMPITVVYSPRIEMFVPARR